MDVYVHVYQECLEDFCDYWGYGFVDHVITNDLNTSISGTFDFVVSRDKIVFSRVATHRETV